MSDDLPRLAAVVFEPADPVDEAIRAALAPHAGRRVLGWLQGLEAGLACDCSEIVLQSLHDGTRRRITQDLGPEARGCRLDSAALAEVAGWLAAGLADDPPELLVLNRFGKVEAAGGGLRGVLELALAADVPVLVPVNRRQLSFWRDFAGGMATELPCTPGPIGAWIAAALPPAQPRSTVKMVASPSAV